MSDDFTLKSYQVDRVRDQYFFTRNGKLIPKKYIKRIHQLGVPPAYKKIWLSNDEKSNLQVIALDGKNRKQYFYSSDWIEGRSKGKLEQVYNFATRLPKLKRRLQRDIKLLDGCKNKTMAIMLKIVENSCMRIGNKKYLDRNDSYGLTTLKGEHITIINDVTKFSFKGKHSVSHSFQIKNKEIARFLRAMRKLPCDWLMKYRGNDGNYYRVSAQDLNSYIHETMGEEFSCKDFRTYGANKIFLKSLQSLPLPYNPSEINKNISMAMNNTAIKLGNNKATSKKSYVVDYITERYKKNPEIVKMCDLLDLLKKVYK